MRINEAERSFYEQDKDTWVGVFLICAKDVACLFEDFFDAPRLREFSILKAID